MYIFLNPIYKEDRNYLDTFQPKKNLELDFDFLFDLYSNQILGLTEEQCWESIKNNPAFITKEKTENVTTNPPKNRDKNNKTNGNKAS